jgi:hypothetical protein
MAFREVVLTEEEQKAGGGRQWKKFEAIGDSALGFFAGVRPPRSSRPLRRRTWKRS